ncbi:4-hydroxythreonine-4-phosphate dehydrogenase PdxA [Parvibaculum sp.]|uniref:4-hydroxythreonine-4-phosphate dehydrogenase PdxA n=1 Tax=Parvibaculum sp. TaxID=2024848 RepID=UPI001DB44711|nr:4-hydroxythreonine-4-phosphate dehydrogenase PdxA [Parvibaculum sp.]MBX3491068.1 4-hydroxythreonine-4-phosphate dehydrogenase PdxA [Parvibaculum sp.]MCW5728888.1 4-hydroxythreonine-4-phosphate dehydrogenase PdxA [Parvibaculum sp.]
MTRVAASGRVQPLALTMGEPAGIGPEITLKVWLGRDVAALPCFFVTGDPALYRALGAPVEEIATADEAAEVFHRALPVMSVPLAEPAEPGRLAPANARAVLAAIDMACDLAMSGNAGGMVTNPIHKRVLYEAGLDVPGHTEYLAARTGGSRVAMMLSCPGLRVVPATVHLSLRDAAAALSVPLVTEQGTILARALRDDFGIARPRIAVAALNPHAGEEGHLGREEIDIIAPAIDAIRAAVPDIEIWGPAPADTLFHAAAWARYDAVLCMYHDQALIPLKTIDFEHGVNTTLGLPIVRTSPDHGTALDIAGRGTAHPGSLAAAIGAAGEMARSRARA